MLDARADGNAERVVRPVEQLNTAALPLPLVEDSHETSVRHVVGAQHLGQQRDPYAMQHGAKG